MGGALLAASLQAALRGGRGQQATAAERMAALNSFVHEHAPVDKYITATYVEVDPATGHLEHAAAGHPPPLLVAPDGSVTKLSERGLPLGLFPDSTYKLETAMLERGGRLVLYTDGILEASAPGSREPFFGTERLIATIGHSRA